MNGTHSPPSIASLTSAGDNRARFVTLTQGIANRAENNSNFPPFTGPGALMNLVQRFTNNTVPVNINENFNVNDFIQQANANMQSKGLRPEDGRMRMPDEEDHNGRMPMDGERVNQGNVAEMDNDSYDNDYNDDDDGDDDDEDDDDDDDDYNDDNDDESESVDSEEEVHDEIVHNFMHTFHNGDYDLEFDDALSYDQGIPLSALPTQASYNKPDNWREANRIGLEKLKEQLQTYINSVSRGTFSNLNLRHNSKFDVHELMDNEKPVVWHEPVLDRYWNHFSAAINRRLYTDIYGIQLENIEITKDCMAALVDVCQCENVKISSPLVSFDNANLCGEGIICLSMLVDVSSQLQEFCLRHNWIDSMDLARCLSRSLKSHTCINQLIITHCELGSSPEILLVILQSDVRRINLSNNNRLIGGNHHCRVSGG